MGRGKHMNEKDKTILKELEKEIGEPLQHLSLDNIGVRYSFGRSEVTLHPAYVVDENDCVAGVNIHTIKALEHFPLSLLKFEHLRTLSFHDVSIRDFTALEKLSHLDSLIIVNTPSANDFSVLQGLSNLTTLDLGGNQLPNVSFLEGLSNLTTLYLSSNQLTDISFVQGLSNLTTLYLNSNQLTDISFVQGLRNLTVLNLSYNQLTDISVLQGLSNLTTLDLGANPLTDISVLQGLSNLTTLDLGSNQLTDISVLQGLSNLTTLSLGGSQLSDISVIQECSNLGTLNLRYNELTDVSALQGLKNLTSLDLRDNKIKKLPEAFIDMGMRIDVDRHYHSGLDISLYGNPLESPPPEIIRKGKDAIKAYFKSLREGEILPLNEVKVLLVGDGGAGKTSLVKRLVGKRFNKNEPQTHGINIKPWDVKQRKNPIKAHLWDFGGQEIMHATHQFFLSKRSLYILVLDGRKDEKTEYWLKHIRSFGGDSPVLVVLNKIDEHQGFDVNRKHLMEKYPNIKGFFRLSCKDKSGIADFKKALKQALTDVEIIGTTWAKSWFEVKKHMEHLTEPYISLDTYNTICSKENITEKSGRDTLVEFLHDLGTILHFDDLSLKDVHVLEPKWVTEAVYKIINAPITAQNKGALQTARLEDILTAKCDTDYVYPPDKHAFILELMEKFELCYDLNKSEVLIPALLDVAEPDFSFDYEGALRFVYRYDFLPPSVMPRFIVRMHNDIPDCCRWRSGVLLQHEDFGAQAVVKADMEEKMISIHVAGPGKRDYFAVIRHTLGAINAGFKKINAVEYVPIPAPAGKSIEVKYEELTGLKKMGKSVISIGELGKDFSIADLLADIEPNGGTGDRTIIAGGDVTVFDMKGDNSNYNLTFNQVEQKLEMIVKQLEEHEVPGREELIPQLQDETVKKDKNRLRGVLGKVLTRAAEIGTIGTIIASLL
ncbi:MAG: GTP-binding protein [bacterium]|nr:GTP-binding protein [bacterium]